MLERLDAIKGKVFNRGKESEFLTPEQLQARKFSNIIDSALGEGVIKSHFNQLEIGILFGHKGKDSKFYYFKEDGVNDKGQLCSNYYVADDDLLIYKQILSKEKLEFVNGKIIGKKVNDETLEKLKLKIQKIKKPLG
jgi:hypothetical protein